MLNGTQNASPTTPSGVMTDTLGGDMLRGAVPTRSATPQPGHAGNKGSMGGYSPFHEYIVKHNIPRARPRIVWPD